ncbi:hypothetical protein A3D70_01230 [Candidatus Adlerbacteria bacterium RIFCSPHIGHO2_02_FULL_54_18]|uniref:Peptidoglycan binding-like domain-containing protein n=2 Tax=Candidatus Adleribacteriota TaxID=1752736 RepID=A0A1F4Y540_9BACT|nr:MAG: hypothetical protein A2949_02165 [Candidatus Adlerbacteria bacterium RIFCSPLOWO2_01_FULL_54_21b]OGC89041.1 MAG: hypothetical protein A3D70_01230 [Candidatus Adlerbacteria bacterium RIFCSPHIGHO2_02_FULL_54_18]
MKKLLTRTGIVIALLLPSLAFAAYDDVTLTTDTVLSVNGVTMNITSSSATMETLTVNSTNFSVNVLSGSTLTVTAASQKVMSISTEPVVSVTTTCTSSTSSFTYTASVTATITVTPSSTACPLTTSSTSSGGGGSPSLIGGGGGGGGSSAPSTPASTPASTPTPSNPVSGLSSVQVEAILSLLASFDADAATIANVRAALYGQASTGTGSSVSAFVRNLELGMSGADVKALQVYLNTHGYVVSSSGPGSPGNETSKFGGATKAALIKFQKAMGITPAVGYFGPKTRAAAK